MAVSRPQVRQELPPPRAAQELPPTTSGAGTGVNTPASEVSVGTKRKHNEIDDSDPDIIEKYQRMILELMGVMVSSNFHSKYPY